MVRYTYSALKFEASEWLLTGLTLVTSLLWNHEGANYEVSFEFFLWDFIIKYSPASL